MAKSFFRTIAEKLAAPIISTATRVIGGGLRRIGEALSRVGVTIEADAARRLEHAIEQEQRAVRVVLGVGDTDVIDPLNIPDAVSRLRRQFAWTMRVDHIDRTGQRRVRYITVSTDHHLSPQQAIEAARRDLEAGDYDYRRGSEVSITVERVVKAGALGTL